MDAEFEEDSQMMSDDAGQVVRTDTFPEKAFVQGLRTEIVRLSRSCGKSIIDWTIVQRRTPKPTIFRDKQFSKADTIIHGKSPTLNPPVWYYFT